MEEKQTYCGMWVTRNGYIHHELFANGRYDEARGNNRSAYQGEYYIYENNIYYRDDTGFTADGIFIGKDELHHAGMIFFRQK